MTDSTPDIVKKVISKRNAQGLHVQTRTPEGRIFNYYPKTQDQKADFERRAKLSGHKVI